MCSLPWHWTDVGGQIQATAALSLEKESTVPTSQEVCQDAIMGHDITVLEAATVAYKAAGT
jgi:hypothetical protein